MNKNWSFMTNTQSQGWTIHPESNGFQSIPTGFGGIAKYLCIQDRQVAGFAFAASLFERSINPSLTDAQLIGLAEDKIKECLKENLVSDRDELTFLFENNEFREDPNAVWWNKTL
jgi:hypothetical protein